MDNIKLIFVLIIIIILINFLNKKSKNYNYLIKELNNIDILVIFDKNKNNDKNKAIITIKDKSIFNDIITEGTLGLGEGYMYGKWDTPDLYLLLKKLIMNREKLEKNLKFNLNNYLYYLSCIFTNKNSIGYNSKKVIDEHYNLSNNLYENMLDKKYMQYTCAYWKPETKTLQEAQINKLKLIACKLNLKPGMNVIDIGCGFGGLAYFLATEYGVSVTGINLCEEHLKYANKNYKHKNLKYELKDYRHINKNIKYDRVVSVGLFEHIGSKNYKSFFKLVNDILKDNGYFLLHFIGNASKTYSYDLDKWIDKYIFPGANLPSLNQTIDSFMDYFSLEDFQNIGLSYVKTLRAWRNNFDNAIKDNKLEKKVMKDTFIKMWHFYLITSEIQFELRNIHLWHFLLVKRNKLLPQSTFARLC